MQLPCSSELIFRAYEQKTGVRVLPLYDTEETKTAGLTSRLLAETDHNPHFGTMSFHAAALFLKWGDAEANAFFEMLKSNSAVVAAGNADVKDRVSDGRVDLGILDEDDAIDAIREKKPVALLLLDQEGPDALGTPLMPNAALLIHGSPHPDEGRRFMDFLTSAEAEQILASSDAAQYALQYGKLTPGDRPWMQTDTL